MSEGTLGTLGTSGRAFVVGAAALLVVRMCLTAHAPAFVDAHACLAAIALAFVAAAARSAQIAAALVVAGAALSLPTSWDPWMSALALPSVLGAVAFLLLASSGSNRGALLAACGIGGALNAVAAVVQKTITWPHELARLQAAGLPESAVLANARPIGLSLSPDLAGGLCLAGAFCAFALALDTSDRRLRAGLIALAALSASALVVVRSFGSALALVVGVGVVAVLWSRRAAIAGGALGAGAFAVAVATRGTEAILTSASERLENWRTALEVFLDAPLFGVGLMRFGAAYLEHRPPDANITRYAHSGPLQILAETGIVGALLALAALVVVMRALWARRATLTPADRVLAGAGAALAVRACIDYDLHVAQSASVTAVVVGLLIARTDPAPAEKPQRRALAGAAVVALALVVVLGWREGVLESEDPDAIGSYVAKVPFDTEPRIAIAARAVDELAICTASDGCADARTRAFAMLDPLCERAHPSAVALVLRARAKSTAGHLQGALADVDKALGVDRGNASAHVLGVGIAHALRAPDLAARAENARRWGVDTSLASQITF